MDFLVDTNLLVFSANPSSPFYAASVNATKTLLARGDALFILPQNLIEFWVVATRPTTSNGLGMSVSQAEKEIAQIKSLFRLLDETPAIYAEWEKLVVDHAVSGKNAHDARLVASMVVHKINQILTFNFADFKRYSVVTAVDPQSV